jgi:NAD(P)H dehydrogenase (quinone)
VLKQLVNALQKENHHVEISDLYDMNFQTDMTEQEYEREGFAKIDLPVSDDIAKEHEKIEQSDCIIFLYPVWWSDCPAKLKGWFDRVYSVGYAYGYDANGQKIQKMKKIKSGIVICTAGHSNEFLEETEIAESMRKVMLNDRLGERFDKKEMIILGGTLYIEEVEEFHTDCLRKLVKQIR